MQKQDLTTWLNSSQKNWKEGLALLVAFSNNKHLTRVLMSKGQSARTIKSLEYELNKIDRASPYLSRQKKRQLVIKTPIVVQPEKFAIHKLRPSTGEQSSDPVLIPLENKTKEIYVEAASIFYQLLHLPKSECEISCLRILDMMSENQAVWNQINYYKKYKFLPSKDDVVTQLDMKTRITTLRTYISRHHKLIANAKTEVTRQKYQLKLDEFIAERNDLELKLSV
jgi:ribosomal protein S18